MDQIQANIPNNRKVNKHAGFLRLSAAGLPLLLIWQLAAMQIGIPHIFPSPAAILLRTWELRETLFLRQLPVTLSTIITGLALSVAIALVLAVIMDACPVAEAMLYPTLVISQTLPVMCIAPLFVLWFGYSRTARLIAVVIATFFAITLNVFDGLRRTDPEKIRWMKTAGAGSLDIFIFLKVPSALPMFFTALKMTLPWAVVDAAVAEWLGATEGLGCYSKRMISKMDGPAVFAPVLILTILALAGMAVLNRIDRRVCRYRNEL